MPSLVSRHNKLFNLQFLVYLLTFVLLGFYFFKAHPLTTNDTYFHLSVGREVAQTHQIPTKDNFVFGSEKTEYISAEWLSGYIFYQLNHFFGMHSLFVLRVLCGLLTIFLLYKALKLLSSNYLLISLLLLLAGYLLPFRLSTRPEMFSLVLFALVNYTCLHYFFKKKNSKTTYFMPIVFLLWPNLHGISPIGFGIYTFFAVFFYFKFKGKKFFLVYLISLLFYIPQYNLILSFLHAPGFSQYITEFQSLWARIFPSAEFKRFHQFITLEIYIYITTLTLYSFYLVKTFQNKDFNPKIIGVFYLLLLLLPLQYFRLIVPILLIVFPVFIYLGKRSAESLNSLYLTVPIIFTAFLILMSIYSGYILGGTKSVEIFPEGAEKAIETTLNTERLFTIYYWNDYFFWKIPTIKTYADVMTQYRSQEDMDDERKLHSADQEVEDLLKKYDIDTVVSTQPDANRVIGLSRTAVQGLDNWRLIYLDNTASVYARTDIIKNNAIDLSAINATLSGPLKFELRNEEHAVTQLNSLLKFNNKNDFAWEQLIYYYFSYKKDLAKAESLTKTAIKELPSDPFFYFILAAIHLERNNCREATYYAKISQSKNNFDESLKNSNKTIIERCAY